MQSEGVSSGCNDIIMPSLCWRLPIKVQAELDHACLQKIRGFTFILKASPAIPGKDDFCLKLGVSPFTKK